MEIPANYIEKFRPAAAKPKLPGAANTNRAELIETFFLKLNHERTEDGFPPLRLGAFLKYFKGWTEYDISIFLADCQQAYKFSARFWKVIKAKQEKEKKPAL